MTLTECLEAFESWYSPLLEEIRDTSTVIQVEVPNNGEEMDTALSYRSTKLAWANEKLAEAKAWNQQAYGIATEELCPKYQGAPLAAIAKGRIYTVSRAMDILDRLSATLLHQCEALITRISRAKAEYYATRN